MPRLTTLLLAACLASSTQAFTVPTLLPASRTQPLHGVKDNEYLKDLSQQNPDMGSAPKVNPDRPELPEIPGDYDWDSQYQGDADWVSDPNLVPGKKVMGDAQLAAQVTALSALEDKWRKERDVEMDEEVRKVGWVPRAETFNGRTAMFFLVTGLLTEYWTGVSLPGQVEEMLRVMGFIGFE